jgi:hypothetical protein
MIVLRTLFMAAVVAAGIASVAAAEKEHRRHGAHQHGVGKLNVVWEGNKIDIELENPADNIVGFEHAPRTDSQKKAVQEALATLKDAGKVFGFPPEAQCRGQASSVKTESEASKGEPHSEFHAQYRFTCEKPDALKTVDVYIFKLFPKTRTLQTQIVSPKGQTSTQLKRGLARITFQ